MQDELGELFEAAMYKEVASRTLYEKGQGMTQDPGAVALEGPGRRRSPPLL